MPSRRVGAFLVVSAGLVGGGCNLSDRTAGPSATDAPCAGGAALALQPLHGATLDCSTGTTVTLPAGRASYLVALQLPVGDAGATPVPYEISVPSSATLSTSPVSPAFPGGPGARGTVAAAGSDLPGYRQATFDAALRAADAALATRVSAARGWNRTVSGVRVGDAAEPSPLSAADVTGAAGAPDLGSTRTFHVLATSDYPYDRYAPVSAVLRYAGDNLLVYVDATAAGSFTDAQIAAFGDRFDHVLYPLDLATFGAPSDIDENGRLIMVLSPVVNALTPRSQCGPLGYVAGFFTGHDLVGTDATSNRGEVFYAIVPDPAGTYSCAHGFDDAASLLGATFLHEVQHLISYSQHVLVHGGKPNSGWLDEGLSLIAEELGATYYEGRALAAGSTSAPLVDTARAFLANVVSASRGYLLRPDTVSITSHDDSDPGTQWRGGTWLLLRWLGDHAGGARFYRALVQEPATGVPAIETAAGEVFGTLFGDFALALYADSLPAVAKTAIPLRNTFTSRTLAALYDGGLPLQPLPLTGPAAGALPPGGIAYYRLTTTSSSPVVLRVSAPGGAPLAGKWRPQVGIFRLP